MPDHVRLEHHQKELFAGLVEADWSQPREQRPEFFYRIGFMHDAEFVSKYERGDRRLDVVELRNICLACNVTFANFARRFERLLG